MHLEYRPNDSENGASRVTAKSKQTTSDTSWGRIVLLILSETNYRKQIYNEFLGHISQIKF